MKTSIENKTQVTKPCDFRKYSPQNYYYQVSLYRISFCWCPKFYNYYFMGRGKIQKLQYMGTLALWETHCPEWICPSLNTIKLWLLSTTFLKKTWPIDNLINNYLP